MLPAWMGGKREKGERQRGRLRETEGPGRLKVRRGGEGNRDMEKGREGD